MRLNALLRALLAVPALTASAVALAHPKLVSSTPADQAQVAAPATIELRFSERLLPEFSTATLLKAGAADQAPVTIETTSSRAPDAKTLVLTPQRPLAAGQYRVDWRAVSTDTHRITGSLKFQVR